MGTLDQFVRRALSRLNRSHGRQQLRRFVIGRAGSAALAIGVVLAPVTIAAADTSQGMVSASRAAAGVSSPPALTAAIGAEGSDGQLWVQAPQMGAGWQPLGGQIIAPPAVAAAASASDSTPADPLFIATGTDGALWIRSVMLGWQPVGAAECVGGPGAVITGTTLTVACRGTDNALWYNTATVSASGLPVFTGSWTSLGGVLSAGPAIALVGTTVTFFVRGSNGQIFTRTASAGYATTPWFCYGSPAAAQLPGSGNTTFACQGTDRLLWEASSVGTVWGQAFEMGGELGGTLTGGPAVVAGGLETDVLAEWIDSAVWERTPAGAPGTAAGWVSLGGGVVGGVGAVALNMAAGAPWGNAIAVPVTATLGSVFASVASLSCPLAGNCVAGGSYTVDPCPSPCIYQPQALVVSEVNGTWGDAIEVPGTAALNTGNSADVKSVSCASAGSCAVGGDYAADGADHAFVADEVSGVWKNAIEVPGTASLSIGASSPFTSVGSVSCGSAGNCAIGGGYTDSSGKGQAFVADEVNGTWHNAIEVPGIAALNTGGSAGLQSMSCPSAGNCAATGSYTDSSGHQQAFVADEVSGVWKNAIEVPGTAALNTGGSSPLITQDDSVSCGSAGNCAVGGDFTDSSGHSQAFVANEVNGTWGDAIEVPGTAALNTGNAFVHSVSCPSAGNCSAGGDYSIIYPASGRPSSKPFVVSEVNGKWGDAIEVPGTAAANALLPDLVSSVSCGSPGNCAAGGYYDDSSGSDHAFVVSEVNGTWGIAIQVPGTTIDGYVSSLSCPAAGGCAAAGFGVNQANLGPGQGFVVSQT